MATATAPTGFGRPIWNAIKGGNQVHGVGLVAVSATFNGTNHVDHNVVIFTAPRLTAGGSWKVEAAQFVSDTNVPSEGTNFWTYNLQVGTYAPPTTVTWTALGDASLTSDSTLLTAFVPYGLDVDGPEDASPKLTYLGEGDSVRLNCDAATSSSTDTSGFTFTVTLFLRHSPPGR